MKNCLAKTKPLWCGILIGTMGVLPGVSGGALAAALGYYELLMFTAAHPLKAAKTHKRTLFFLLPGIGAGIVLFGRVFLQLFEAYPTGMRCVVAGLILGTLFSAERETQSKRERVTWATAATAAFGTGLFLFYGGLLLPLTLPFRFYDWMLCGGIYAAGTVVPGVSASCILLAMDAYEPTLAVVAGENIAAIFPFLVGFLAVAAILVCIVNRLYSKHRAIMDALCFGFVVSSVIPVIPPLCATKTDVIAVLCGLTAMAGTAMIACKDRRLYTRERTDLSKFG